MRMIFWSLPLLLANSLEAQEIKTIIGGNAYESTWIVVDGQITDGAADRLNDHLQTEYVRNGLAIPTVALNSPGGSLIEGMRLGLLFRELNVATTIARKVKHFSSTEDSSVDFGWVESDEALCASACAYAFLGGVERYIIDDYQIGFHQFYNQSEASNLAQKLDANEISSDAQFVTGLLVEYIDELGDIDFKILAEAAKATKNQMNWLSRDVATELGVISDDFFEHFFLEPYGRGVVAASRAQTSATGYDTSRAYYEVAQATAFCRDNRQYLMLSSDAESDLQLISNEVRWSFDFGSSSPATHLSTSDNIKVRVNKNKTYIDIDVTEIKSAFSEATRFWVSVAVPRSQGGNFTFEKTLSTEEQKIIDAAFRLCI